MKIKIFIFAQNTILSRSLLNTIENKFRKRIKIVGLCSDDMLYGFCKSLSCFESDLNYVNNKKKNERKILKVISNYKPQVAFSFQHKWILSEKLINAMNSNIYNFHFGKIPEFRGHNPINYAILSKQKYIYATTHKIYPLVDTGEIVFEDKIKNLGEIPRKIEIKLVKLFENHLEKILRNFLNNEIVITKKIILNKKYNKFYKFADIQKIKKIKSFKELECKALAFNQAPHEPAFFIYRNQKYYVLKDYREYRDIYK